MCDNVINGSHSFTFRVKIFHSTFGAEQFLHDVIDSFYPAKFDASVRYSEIKPADLATIFEAFRLFITQCINLELTKDQVTEYVLSYLFIF
jgi:hypothetical protein